MLTPDFEGLASVVVGAIVNHRRNEWTFGRRPFDLSDDRLLASVVGVVRRAFQVGMRSLVGIHPDDGCRHALLLIAVRIGATADRPDAGDGLPRLSRVRPQRTPAGDKLAIKPTLERATGCSRVIPPRSSTLELRSPRVAPQDNHQAARSGRLRWLSHPVGVR